MTDILTHKEHLKRQSIYRKCIEFDWLKLDINWELNRNIVNTDRYKVSIVKINDKSINIQKTINGVETIERRKIIEQPLVKSREAFKTSSGLWDYKLLTFEKLKYITFKLDNKYDNYVYFPFLNEATKNMDATMIRFKLTKSKLVHTEMHIDDIYELIRPELL